jgi:hypothetical protein
VLESEDSSSQQMHRFKGLGESSSVHSALPRTEDRRG